MKSALLFTITCFFSFTINAQSFIRSELSTPLHRPWEITYGADNHLWLTEYEGVVSRVNPVDGSKIIVFTASDYFAGSPLEDHPHCTNPRIGRGTFGLALHPDFLNPSTAFIYFFYSYNSGTTAAPATKFRVKRLLWDASTNTVVSDTNIINDINSAPDHWGGRLLAIKQNNIPYLFVTIGDHGLSEDNSPNCYVPLSSNPNFSAQDPTTINGKIHRFNMDGSIPIDNPIAGNSFYTRGHRNPQGLMYNPNLNKLYAVEHGDRTDDEINILEKGKNYGWKQVRGYHNDNNHPGESSFVANYTPDPNISNDGLVEAFYSWCSSVASTSSNNSNWCTVAPSDGIYYGSNGIPEWTNSLLVVTLKKSATVSREVYQFKLQTNGELVPSTINNPNPKRFFADDQDSNGRLKDITFSPDGKTIYLINDGGSSRDRITVYTYDNTTNTLPINKVKHELKVYPNPVSDVLNIQNIENIKTISSIEIITSHGIILPIPKPNTNQIDVSYLVKGVYILKIVNQDKTYITRFLKQ